MSRLIDADNLDFTFDRRCFSEGDTQYVRGADDAIEVVNNAPTIDAVPVVRCRECIHYKPQSKSVRCNCTTLYCNRTASVKMDPDDFCSRGERSTDNSTQK